MNVLLTYVPTTFEKERICGHTFEVMDYFLLFYDNNINCTILIQENISKEKIFEAWEDKYVLPDDYKKYVKFSHSKIIRSDIVIFTGGLCEKYYRKHVIKCNTLLIFRCNALEDLSFLNNINYFILEDTRVYKNYNISKNSIHYIKKIYFDRYKKLKLESQDKTLVYINNNLRKTSIKRFDENYLIVSGNLLSYTYPNVIQAPVKDLFNKFNTFLYTPTTGKFDCSPRFIAECFYYNKKILFDFDIDEYAQDNKQSDSGLYWRWYDIRKNFESLRLSEHDDIFKYLRKSK